MGGFYIARLVLCFLMWGFGQKRLFLVLRDSPFFLSPGQRDFFFKPLYDARFGILHWNTLSRILQDSFSFPLFGRSSINSWHHQVVAQNNWLMGCFLIVLFLKLCKISLILYRFPNSRASYLYLKWNNLANNNVEIIISGPCHSEGQIFFGWGKIFKN